MKKLLALALTLVMTLGLVCPAWAAEEPADPLPENWWMDDVAPAEDDYVYIDPDSLEPVWTNPAYDGTYEEYEAAHPEEFENLDPEQLLADWGYHDMTAEELFVASERRYGETLEDSVKRTYIDKRLAVKDKCVLAEEYRAEYPDLWDTFDAGSYFEYSNYYSYDEKETYMVQFCILTEEELVDTLFVDYVEFLNFYNLKPNWWLEPEPYKPDEPTPEPTLTLYVNGVSTDVAITAEEGVTYADADALRQLLGPEAIPADKTGLLPIRATAQAAGWDVAWYDGGWRGVDQEVQLWDKASYETYLAEEFGPLNGLFAQAMKNGGNALFAETPTTTHQTVTADLKRFSTLDGDKTYTVTFDVDTSIGGGVLDATLTFDVSELLKLFPADALESLTKMGGFSVTQLRQFLKAGVMEFIIDYNTGDIAYNIPLLALVDESLAGWQTEYLSGLDGMAEAVDGLEEFSFTSSLYAVMTTTASYMGAEYARVEYDRSVGLLSAFAGKDRFAVQSGKTTYSITTQAMNEAVSALINAGIDEDDGGDMGKRPVYTIFKAFEVTYTMDASGSVTSSLHIRPDTDGIAAAVAKAYESSYYGDSSGAMEFVMNWLLKGWNMDLTATTRGNAQRSTGTVNVHWDNVGTLAVRTTTAQISGKAPRSVEEVAQ